MSLCDAQIALEIFLQSPLCAGVAITEFNAERDPDVLHVRKIIDLICNALSGESETR
jgi:hypothetical protein